MLRRLLLALGLCLLLVAPRPAAAHGYIVRSIPEDRAALERAPARLQYWFSEGLEAAYSSLTVTNQAGEVVARGGVNPDNTTLLETRLPTDLPDGAYIAELRVAFASDGHVIIERRAFFVGEAVALDGIGAVNTAVPLEIGWRALLNMAQTLLLGTFGVYALVLVPAWGNAKYRAGLLPPRVMRRLNLVAAVGLITAAAASLTALMQQTMVFFNADSVRVLSESLWDVVRTGTRFGDVWNGRMLLLLAVAAMWGAALYFRERQPGVVRACWTANTWLLALLLGASAVASHAAGSLVLPWVALASHWLHTVAVALWAGGITVLTLVAPVALAPYTGEARRLALLAVLRRFSPLALGLVGVVVATGIYNSSNWILSPAMAATPYGLALVLKIVLVLAVLLVGGLHHVMLKPERLRRAEQWSARLSPLRALVNRISPLALRGTFLPTLRLELVAAALVLSAAGWLSATPLPVPDFIDSGVPAPRATLREGDLTVTSVISPGGPGVNSYDIVVERGGEAVEAGAVQVRLTNPAADWRGNWLAADPLGEGLYAAASADIGTAGDWWLLVDVEGTRFAYPFTIVPEAAVIESLPPNLINVLALAGVVIAASYAIKPLALRFYRSLDLRPQLVTLAVGATIITAGLLVFGYISLQAAFEQTERTINPPPQIVNPTLPTAESLAQGAALLAEVCAWDADSRDRGELARRLDTLRDEALFALTRDGWRSLPPCSVLSDGQRWHVVNHIRTWER
jgi:copper transport protein